MHGSHGVTHPLNIIHGTYMGRVKERECVYVCVRVRVCACLCVRVCVWQGNIL